MSTRENQRSIITAGMKEFEEILPILGYFEECVRDKKIGVFCGE
jgi:hypothetical protein